MFAVVHIGGKQYKVREKDELVVESLPTEEGKNLKIKEVLLISDNEGKELKLGMPFVTGAHVECQVMEHGRGEKLLIFKKKAKKRYSIKKGHRQNYTILKVLKISAVQKKTATSAKEEVEEPKVAKKPAAKAAKPVKKKKAE